MTLSNNFRNSIYVTKINEKYKSSTNLGLNYTFEKRTNGFGMINYENENSSSEKYLKTEQIIQNQKNFIKLKVNRMRNNNKLSQNDAFRTTKTEFDIKKFENDNKLKFIYNKDHYNSNIFDIFKKIGFNLKNPKKKSCQHFAILKKFEKFKTVHFRENDVNINNVNLFISKIELSVIYIA